MEGQMWGWGPINFIPTLVTLLRFVECLLHEARDLLATGGGNRPAFVQLNLCACKVHRRLLFAVKTPQNLDSPKVVRGVKGRADVTTMRLQPIKGHLAVVCVFITSLYAGVDFTQSHQDASATSDDTLYVGYRGNECVESMRPCRSVCCPSSTSSLVER